MSRTDGSSGRDLTAVAGEVVACTRCSRLAVHRVSVASAPPQRHLGAAYWSRPVPGMGDPTARLLVVGLAPGAHGANRTGLPFHGDAAGEWLLGALHAAGFATHPSPDPAQRLVDTWLTNTVKCVPPENRPAAAERRSCARFLHREWELLRPSVVVALGRIAWDASVALVASSRSGPRHAFGHLAELDGRATTLIGSYHPSRQNTCTGRLTRPMLQAVFDRARELVEAVA